MCYLNILNCCWKINVLMIIVFTSPQLQDVEGIKYAVTEGIWWLY